MLSLKDGSKLDNLTDGILNQKYEQPLAFEQIFLSVPMETSDWNFVYRPDEHIPYLHPYRGQRGRGLYEELYIDLRVQ